MVFWTFFQVRLVVIALVAFLAALALSKMEFIHLSYGWLGGSGGRIGVYRIVMHI